MPELYQVPAGSDVGSNLPLVNLPGGGDDSRRLKIDIHPKPRIPAPKTADPWEAAGFSKTPPKTAIPATLPTTGASLDAWKNAGFSTEPPPPAERKVGTGEAAVLGAVESASFGLAPAMIGLTAAGRAGGKAKATEDVMAGVASEAPGLETAGLGAARLLQGDPEALAAYEQMRQSAAELSRTAREQHPYAFLGGELGGGLLTPGFGAAAPGTLGARLATGAIAGGVGGALYGAGSAVGEGDIAAAPERAVKRALIGAPTGGVLKGAVGPRVSTVVRPGERAAATAAALGAPLPRGVASDKPVIQSTTAKVQQLPFLGERITEKVRNSADAAGEFINQTAATMTGGPTDRAAADVLVRPMLQAVIDDNRAAIDAAYNNVRGMIDQNARFAMPRTDAALTAIMRDRANAGWANPAQGLEQFRNVAGGTTFNGAHRARVDARSAGDALVPHPGYNAADFNRLTRAMTADIRAMVQQAAARNRKSLQRALEAFDRAEQQFGALADQNRILNRLARARGEGAIATLLGAAKEKRGDIRLLAQLRNTMPRQDFEVIGGTLLHELGHNAATGEFSLAQFVTNWNKMSDRAKDVLFDAQHHHNIEDIVNLGQHIKRSLRQTTTSHSAGLLVLLEVAKDSAALAVDIAAGGGGAFSAAGAASSVALWTLAHWLGNSAQASSMAAWARAYNNVALRPIPARMAAFKLATRNMANTLNLDPIKVMRKIEGVVAGGQAESVQPDRGNENEQQ